MSSGKEAAARAEARIGNILNGKYRLDGVLGAGGMAVVYEVTHRNQMRFALKMLHGELSGQDDIRRRFLREGYAANSVGHPGAVAVLDDDLAEDGAAFLVMELLDGLPLDEILDRHERRLSGEAVLAVADQLLEVLAAAHSKGIVHRDIKPANLFVLRDGTLKVLDFGIARLREVTGGSQTTHTGVMLGTPAYMPPEQALALASQIDAQSDIWSVGATLFTLLSGANVHPGQSAAQILIAAATRPARSVTAVAPWVDPRIAALVDRALPFEKTERWPSAEAMREGVGLLHEEVFGARPSRASLASFVGPGQRSPANPSSFVLGTPSGAEGGTREPYADRPRVEKASIPSPSVTATLTAGQMNQVEPGPSFSPGSSTATPVASGARSAPPVGATPARRRLWAVGAVLCIGAGALVIAMWGRGAPAPIDASARLANATTAMPTATPSAIPTPTPSAIPTPTPSAIPTPTPTPTPIPTATGTTASAIPTATSTSTSTGTTPTASMVTTPRSAPASARPMLPALSASPSRPSRPVIAAPALPASAAPSGSSPRGGGPNDEELFHP
jgi:serine/threonine protein kinase